MASRTQNEQLQTGGTKPERTGLFKVFVGGLPPDTQDRELMDYLSTFGKVAWCKTKRWKNDPHRCGGYGTVAFVSKQAYEKVLGQQHCFRGRIIECKRAISNRKELQAHHKQVAAQKLFVTGIPCSITDQLLHDYFRQFGHVDIAYIIKQHDKQARIGFVCFSNSKDRLLALKASHKIQGTPIFVSEYHTKGELTHKPAKETTPSANNSHKSRANHTARTSSEEDDDEDDYIEIPTHVLVGSEQEAPARLASAEHEQLAIGASLVHKLASEELDAADEKGKHADAKTAGSKPSHCEPENLHMKHQVQLESARSPDGIYHPFSCAGRKTGSKVSSPLCSEKFSPPCKNCTSSSSSSNILCDGVKDVRMPEMFIPHSSSGSYSLTRRLPEINDEEDDMDWLWSVPANTEPQKTKVTPTSIFASSPGYL